jgi:hypothetical protein
MNMVCKEHMTIFHKHLHVCDLSLGPKFLHEIQTHYDMNLESECLLKNYRCKFWHVLIQIRNFFGLGSGINLEFSGKLKNFQSRDFQMPFLINGFT